MSDATDRVGRIRARLTEAFKPDHLEVHDDGARHRGHTGAATGKGHFNVEITAPAFAGLSLIESHRRIYAALGEMMETDIHALSITARPPD